MTGHQIIAWRRDKHTGAVRGDSDVIFDAMKAANALCVYRWSRPEAAYLILLSRYGAVLDALRARGHHVEWHGRPSSYDELGAKESAPAADDEPEQAALW